MLKDRQSGRELQSGSTTSSRNSSTSSKLLIALTLIKINRLADLDIFSERSPSSGFASRLSSANTNATSLPSSSVPTRPLSSDNQLLPHYSSDSIPEPIREALSDPRNVVDIVDGIVRRGTLEGLVQHLIGTYNHSKIMSYLSN